MYIRKFIFTALIVIFCGAINYEALASTSLRSGDIYSTVKKVYQENKDRFELTCWLDSSGNISQDSAIVSPDNPVAHFQADDLQLVLTMLFPRDLQAALAWLSSYPHNRFDYLIKSSQGVISEKTDVWANEQGILTIQLASNISATCFATSAQSSLPILTYNKSQVTHIDVHPHTQYDRKGLLAGKIEPILNDDHFNNIVLLEGQMFPYYVSEYLPGITDFGSVFWNPANGITLSSFGKSTLYIAPAGKIMFHKINTNISPTVLITGGFLDACVGQTIPFLAKAVFDSGLPALRVILVQNLMLEDQNTLMKKDEAGFEKSIKDAFAINCKRYDWDCGAYNYNFNFYEEEFANVDEIYNFIQNLPWQTSDHLIEFDVIWGGLS